MNKLDEFVSELLAAKGVAETPELHAELLEKINDKIDRAILEALPGDVLDQMENSINDNTITEDAVKELIEKSGINTEEITFQALEAFRDEFLNEEA